MKYTLFFTSSLFSTVLGFPIGDVDTIGFTYYDWQFTSSVWRIIVNDPRLGVHCLWMCSPDSQSGFPNRNMRYNFYEFSTRTWIFGQEGIDLFPFRTGYGNLHILPTGEIVASAHTGSPIRPIILRDLGTSEGPENFLYPPISVTRNGWIHCAMIEDSIQRNLYYVKIREWPYWTEPILIASPEKPTHNITSSLNTNDLIIMWTERETGSSAFRACYRISTNGGDTWSDIVQLPYPPAFTPGSETIPSFYTIYGFFDRNENPHFVASLYPIVDGVSYTYPAEIWHYSPLNIPAWSKVRRREPLPTIIPPPVGLSSILATRPTIGQNFTTGELVVIWEEFTPWNIEPTTQYLRGAIWASASTDNGNTWLEPKSLTDTLSTFSFRFPCVAEIVDDTVWIVYLADSVAGFYVQGQGPPTRNPILCHKVPISGLLDINENFLFPSLNPNLEIFVSPNPFLKSTTIHLPPSPYPRELKIYDCQGRLVKSFSAENVILWDGKDEQGRAQPNGIYFFMVLSKEQSALSPLRKIKGKKKLIKLD